MSETIRKVDYFAMDLANKAGEAARILEPLSSAGVNFLAFAGFPSGRRAQIDFIPENVEAFKAAAKKAKLRLRPRKVGFLIQGDDRPGAVAGLLRNLADAKINVIAIHAVSAGEGRYGAMLWVNPGDVSKAAKAMGAV